MRWISALLVLIGVLGNGTPSHAQSRALMAWSASLNLIALGIADQVRLHDGQTQQLLAVLEGAGATLTALAWQPEGVLLATGDAEGRVCLWSGVDFTRQCSTSQGGAIRALAWQAEGAWLASAEGERVRVWQVEPLVARYEWSAEGVVTALAWQADRLAVGGALRGTYEQGFLALYDIQGSLQRRYLAEMRPPLSLQSLADDQLGVSTPFEVFTWQSETGRYMPLYLPLEEGESVRGVAWSPDGAQTLIVVGARLLCFAEGAPYSAVRLSASGRSLAWAAEGQLAALLTDDGSLYLIAAARCEVMQP
jgi:WD40 repeat protein